MRVIDNFLPPEVHSAIKNILLGADFPWYFNNGKSVYPESLGSDFIQNFQFTHSFFRNHAINSPNYWHVVAPVIDKLKPLALMRVKANLTTPTESVIQYGWHLDRSHEHPAYDNSKHMVGIYYVNSNNGKTVLKDGTEIESVENRLAILKGNVVHTGTSCTDQKARCVINFNYIQVD